MGHFTAVDFQKVCAPLYLFLVGNKLFPVSVVALLIKQ